MRPDGLLRFEQIEVLFEIFNRRLRITDEFGTLNRRFCILLPDTPGDGAFHVAAELCEAAKEQSIQIQASVLVYPDDFDQSRQPPDAVTDDGQSRRRSRARPRKGIAGPRESTC